MLPELNNEIYSIPESLSIKINQIISEKKEKGEKIYNLSLGELYFDIPSFKISGEEFRQNYHYSSSMGLLGLREKICSLYKNYYNVEVNPKSEILISNGSKPIIFMLLKTVLKQGEEVLLPEPCWLSYQEQIKLAGGKCVEIPFGEKIEDWEKYITQKTKVILINNPNNPSGYLYSREELNYLLELAVKYNLFILSDEAYSDFIALEDEFVSFMEIDENKEHSLVVNSLSKNFGIPGWRLGYAIAHNKVIRELLKLNQHLLTCAATPLQDYVLRHFDELAATAKEQTQKALLKRKEVENYLKELDLKYIEGCGTFYFMIDVSTYKGTTQDLVKELITKHNIATVSGAAYGKSTQYYVRIAIGIENIDNIKYCLRIIKNYL